MGIALGMCGMNLANRSNAERNYQLLTAAALLKGKKNSCVDAKTGCACVELTRTDTFVNVPGGSGSRTITGLRVECCEGFGTLDQTFNAI
jgi:hypothetical protein